ncbi:MAG: adenine deaminase [Candidatus Methanofastidiosia archaeon]
MHIIEGNIIDVINGEIYPGIIHFNDKICRIVQNDKSYDKYIVPGYIDAHIHIESTMLPPSSFSWAVAPHGTVAVIADPHEIANVMGTSGVEYMVEDAKNALINIYFTAPSCVPATRFETSGATLNADSISKLMKRKEFVALGEMMNYPGVINGDAECLGKIACAKKNGKPVDGHCPGITGNMLRAYAGAGISTDHESTTLEEAMEKSSIGMKILVREGSSARNLEALAGLKDAFAFCTDDKHVFDLLSAGHMDAILAKAVSFGIDPLRALKMATFNPASHYTIEGGAIKENAPATMLVLKDLSSFMPERVYIRGNIVAKNGVALQMPKKRPRPLTRMSASPISTRDIKVRKKDALHIIGAHNSELLTDHLTIDSEGGKYQKIVVVDRYGGGHVAAGHIKGMDMKNCAIAQTIAHDSHNIIATGSSDELIVSAINEVIRLGGGIVACSPNERKIVPLDIAGLMSTKDPAVVSQEMEDLMIFIKNHNAKMQNIVTTLSFMALLVMPHLKISDMGLFDVDSFSFIG